jgi:hypothetical protein
MGGKEGIMKLQLRKTRGCFSPISLGHDPIRSLYVELFGWALEIAIAPRTK